MKHYKKIGAMEFYTSRYVTSTNMEEVAAWASSKIGEVYSSRAKFLVLPGAGNIAWPTDTILRDRDNTFIAVNSATLAQHYEEV